MNLRDEEVYQKNWEVSNAGEKGPFRSGTGFPPAGPSEGAIFHFFATAVVFHQACRYAPETTL